MPGPAPKDPALRQRRNVASSRAMLPAGAIGRKNAPKLPELDEGQTWHPMVKRFWKMIWQSPMSGEFVHGDEPALYRLIVLINLWWQTQKLEYAKEIRLLEREFGLTPLSRRRLEWTVAQAEEAKDQHQHKQISRAVVIDADPRGVLEE